MNERTFPPSLRLHVSDVARMSIAPDENGDALTIARCREGSREAFEILLRRYRDRAFNLAFSILGSRDDAEDATQEAFTQAFSHLASFRGEAGFWTWLGRITLNICLHRKRRAKPCESFDETQHESAPVGDARDVVEAKMLVESALDALPEALRVVLILREMHDLTYEEIAQITNVPIGTVRSRLSTARVGFKKAWRDNSSAA